MKFATPIDSSFHKLFLCRMQFDSIAHSRTSFKLESTISNPAAPLSTKLMSYSKSFVVISIIFTASPLGDEGNSDLKKPLSLVVHKKKLICSCFTLRLQQFSHIFRPTSNCGSLAISTKVVVTLFTEVLNPSKFYKRLGIDFFQTPINIDNLTSSYES